MAKSLLEGLDVEKKSAPKRGGGGGGGAAKTKTYVAIALLAVAVGILVWYYGLRGSGAPEIEPVDQAVIQQQQQEAQKVVEQAKQRGAQVGGGD